MELWIEEICSKPGYGLKRNHVFMNSLTAWIKEVQFYMLKDGRTYRRHSALVCFEEVCVVMGL